MLLMDVLDEDDPWRAQPWPQGSHEGDSVDDLEHHVRLASDAATVGQSGAGEHGEPRAGAVNLESWLGLLERHGAVVGPGEQGDMVAPVGPPSHQGMERGSGTPRV